MATIWQISEPLSLLFSWVKTVCVTPISSLKKHFCLTLSRSDNLRYGISSLSRSACRTDRSTAEGLKLCSKAHFGRAETIPQLNEPHQLPCEIPLWIQGGNVSLSSLGRYTLVLLFGFALHKSLSNTTPPLLCIKSIKHHAPSVLHKVYQTPRPLKFSGDKTEYF